VPKSAGLQVGALEKRKGIMQISEVQKVARRKQNLVVPNEGPSNV